MSRFKMTGDLMAGGSQTITDDSYTTDALKFKDVNLDGYASVQLVTSGAGTFKLELLGANEDQSALYKTPVDSSGSDIDPILAAGTATGTTGVIAINLPLIEYGKLKVTSVGEVTIEHIYFTAQ